MRYGQRLIMIRIVNIIFYLVELAAEGDLAGDEFVGEIVVFLLQSNRRLLKEQTRNAGMRREGISVE